MFLKSIIFILIVMNLYAKEDVNHLQAKKYPLPSAWSLANSCSACHGTNGAELQTDIPSLAGMPKSEFIAIMQAYKSEKVVKTAVMSMIAKQVSDKEIELMADFFSKQKAKEWTKKGWNDDVKKPF